MPNEKRKPLSCEELSGVAGGTSCEAGTIPAEPSKTSVRIDRGTKGVLLDPAIREINIARAGALPSPIQDRP